MQDLAYMALLLLFLALAVAFVYACDRIIGDDDVALAEAGHRSGDPVPPAAGGGTQPEEKAA
jgi:hypothetical protein